MLGAAVVVVVVVVVVVGPWIVIETINQGKHCRWERERNETVWQFNGQYPSPASDSGDFILCLFTCE